MSTDELLVEARARITWGEEPGSVRLFLTSNGISTADADSKIQEFVTERTREIKKRGLRRACIGAIIVCACAGFLLYCVNHPSKLFPSNQGKAMVLTGFLGLYGIWRLVSGLLDLVWPKSETRSITEISD